MEIGIRSKRAGRGAKLKKISHEPLFEAWHKELARRPTLSQKELALIWGRTEGAISQYLRGHTPLNIEAQLYFARYLEVPITQIWPDFEFRDMCPGNLPPGAISVAVDWTNIDPAQQAAFAAIIRAAAKRR